MIAQPTKLAIDNASEKSLYLLELPGLEDWPKRLNVETPHFGLFMAIDAHGKGDKEILGAARTIVSQGLAYLCAWGPGCERVHDLFDVAVNRENPPASDETVVMTTSHEGESLDEALWFFVNTAHPSQSYEDTCRSWLATSIGNREWADHMRERLVDPRRFTQEMLTDINEILIPEHNVDYLHQRLPSARDKEIGELIAPILQGADYRNMRDRITSDHSDVLSAFSERMASVAVHQKDKSLLVIGLVALVLGGLDRANKEAILVLPLHYKSAEKLDVDPAVVFESAARLVGDPGATQLRAFVKRPEADRSLSSMGYREVADEGGLLYERTW